VAHANGKRRGATPFVLHYANVDEVSVGAGRMTRDDAREPLASGHIPALDGLRVSSRVLVHRRGAAPNRRRFYFPDTLITFE
jgi:hypothetical protein